MKSPRVALVGSGQQGGIVPAKHINRAQATRLLNQGAKLYDMRDAIAFRDGTIPGAEHLVLRRISEAFKLTKTTPIILFGHGFGDSDLLSAINYLEQYGYTNIYNLGSKETK